MSTNHRKAVVGNLATFDGMEGFTIHAIEKSKTTQRYDTFTLYNPNTKEYVGVIRGDKRLRITPSK